MGKSEYHDWEQKLEEEGDTTEEQILLPHYESPERFKSATEGGTGHCCVSCHVVCQATTHQGMEDAECQSRPRFMSALALISGRKLYELAPFWKHWQRWQLCAEELFSLVNLGLPPVFHMSVQSKGSPSLSISLKCLLEDTPTIGL